VTGQERGEGAGRHENAHSGERATRPPAETADAMTARAPTAELRSKADEQPRGGNEDGGLRGGSRRDGSRQLPTSPRRGSTTPPTMLLIPDTRPWRTSIAEALNPMRAPPSSELTGVKDTMCGSS
jgi:hypothetical protein